MAGLREHGLEPARLCSDEVFVRRVYLDMIGTLPTADEARDFLADTRADKRATLIDALFKRGEFADYWALKWCDILRVKSEFPINLWPNAVQAYHRWVRDALVRNQPYDQFARELLTATGSNFRVAPANFYRAMQGHQPAVLAAAVALTFMGTRLETWPAEQRAGLEVFFSRLAFKTTAEWKEEIVYLDPTPTTPLAAMLPDGTAVEVPVGQDPRRVFADWLIRPDNEWFARSIVNRLWAWLLGRGLIHEPDDIRPDNPPVHPELLAWLEHELVAGGYDLRHIQRLILNSCAYQQSARPHAAQAGAAAQPGAAADSQPGAAANAPSDAERLFACYPVRRLDAEVLIDALNAICGSHENYTSAIPEPFTYIPEDQRTITLADGSISSAFLELFGRPARDTGLVSERDNEPTDAQRLHLLNSSQIQAKIQNSASLRQLLGGKRGRLPAMIDTLYLTILSRYPTIAEQTTVAEYLRSVEDRPQAAADVVWALLNTKEFLYRH